MRRKLKRTGAAILCGAMALSLLAGCGGEKQEDETQSNVADSDSNTEQGQENQGETPEDAGTGEVDHIIVTYLTLGQTPADLQMVQDAINERSSKDIGVEVELQAISAYDAMSQFPTWLATGERYDLMMPLLQDLNTYKEQGLLQPLTGLIAENAPYIQQMTDEGWNFASNNTMDGEIWAVSTVPNVTGAGGGFVVKKQYVDAVDFDYEEGRVYTLDELGELFAAIKEKHPEMYPCGQTGATASYGYVGMYDAMGADKSTGVLTDTDSTTLVDLYETEEYQDYIQHMRDWNLAGYIYPDAAVTDTTQEALVDSGVAAGYFMVSAPIQTDDTEYMIRLTEVFQQSQAMGGWVIPTTAEEPEAAMRFLNYVWENTDIANLIQWGIEGTHYVVLDQEKNLIGFPEGVDETSSGYYNTLGLYGDTRKLYVWSASQSQADNDAYTKEAMANPMKSIGVLYSPSAEAATKIAAITAVVAQYQPALETGSVDVDQHYQAFIAELKAAGVDDVIAEKQAQLDEFLSQQ